VAELKTVERSVVLVPTAHRVPSGRNALQSNRRYNSVSPLFNTTGFLA
jgi:hypothetical protein